MQTLSIMPVADIVLGQLRPWLQNVTPEQAAEFANQIQKSKAGRWYLPGKGPSYTNISEEEAEYLMDTGGVTPSVPEPTTPQQFLARLRNGVNQFGRQFNQTTIRPYNNAIQHALRAVKSLSQMPEISPEIEQQGEQLLSLFQNIQAAGAEDAQLINQLGQVAYQLGQAAGAYQSGSATDVETRAPAQPVQPAGPGIGQKIRDSVGQFGNWVGNQVGKIPSPTQLGFAESDEKILTASSGSAQSLIEVFHTQS